MVSTPEHTGPAFDADAARRKERADRASRLAAMFQRWEAEDISEEPDWDADQIPRLELRGTPDAIEPAS